MVKEYIKLACAKQQVKDDLVLAPLLFSFRFTELDSVLAASTEKVSPYCGAIPCARLSSQLCVPARGGGCCIYLTHSVEVAAIIALYLAINVCCTGTLKDVVFRWHVPF